MFVRAALALAIATTLSTTAEDRPATPASFQTDQLVPWCIVPFDAAKRTPSERAQMLVDLGFRRCAYDWRSEHVAEFETEILEYRKHGIDFFAFWAEHDAAFGLFEKHGLHPQIWITAPSPTAESEDAKVEAAAASLLPLAKRTARMGCQLGLYNHGGWGGEPANLVAVCKALRAAGHSHVGIVYNLHHGHDHIDDWAETLALLTPYLICLNLNGMNAGANPKILPIGQGQHESQMIRTIINSGYVGPIGIIDHRPEIDARMSLQQNLDGLNAILHGKQ